MPYWQNWQNSFLWMFKIESVKVCKRKNLVSVKKRTLFLQNVSVDTWIAIFSKLAKSCRKTFKQHMLQIRIWEKINNFKKQFFPGIMLLWTIEMQFWTSCQNVPTKYLVEISAWTGKRHDFSKTNVFSEKKLPLKTLEIV